MPSVTILISFLSTFLIVTAANVVVQTTFLPPVPSAGLFCCPTVGPGGTYLQSQQTGVFAIFCNYGTGPNPIRCVYNPNDGTGSTIPGCPPKAPANPHPPSCPLRNTLHPNFIATKCIDVRGAVYENGTPVQIYDCNGTGAQNWVISRDSTKVRVAGTNYCLDAGSTPGNGVGMKIWQCYDNLPAQQWFYTADNRIALEGQGLCLDLTDGDKTNTIQLQTWKCTDGNLNQVWSTY